MFGQANMKNQEIPESNTSDLSPRDLIKDLSFCVFDLETTGGNHKSDKIIEIGLVRVQNLEIVEKKNYLIQPEIKIPDFIQKLTSITPKDVENAPVIEDVMEELLEFMGDSVLVAHNVSFDVPFFNSVLRRLQKPELTNRSICTNLMTKYLIPNLMNSNLNYMSKIFNIKHHKAHRALDDAMATAELLLNYLDIFINKNIKKINHLYYPRNRFELDRANYKNDISLEEIDKKIDNLKTCSLITLKGKNGVILYVLPSKNTKNEKNVIKEKLREVKWETATIKLTGPFLESLVAFGGLFNKIDPQVRTEIIKFMWQEHLPEVKAGAKVTSPYPDEAEPILPKDFGDFVIAHHLVPEQMLIYPLASLHQKSELIFRYPGHKKKLLQYINSKSSRIDNNKIKLVYYHPHLKTFIDHYLKNEKEKDNELFVFRKKLPIKKSDEFLGKLDDFLAKNPNSYNYPKEYI